MELNCRLSGRCFICVSRKLILPVSTGFFVQYIIVKNRRLSVIMFYVLCFIELDLFNHLH